MEKIAALPALVVKRFALVAVFLLFTIHYLLFTSVFARPAFAETICPDDPNPGVEPSPQPCKYACYTDKLTDNYVTKEDGTAWKEITLEVPDLHDGDQGTVAINENYVVDFSKLQGIFGATNSNYLEGNFQDDPHRKENIIGLNSQDFNKYHGPGEKIAAKTLVDDLKVKYVKYIWLNSHLPEASNTYTDINNSDKDDPKTIYRLVIMYDQPEPPAPGADETTITHWLETWGKYWEKIPTSYSEFFRGYLVFRYAVGEKAFDLIEKGELCPVPFPRAPIEFVMPEFKRTVSISDQLNQIVVPCAAQSWRHGDGPNPEDPDNCFREYLASSSNSSGNVLSNFIKTCKEIINGASKTLIKQLRNAVQISFQILNPIKTASAASPAPTPTPPPCFLPLKEGKEGNAPFCALPEFTADGIPQLGPCLDKNSPNKLDKDNPRVVCVFNLSWSRTYIASDHIPDDLDQRTDEDFDRCEPDDHGTYTCFITVKIWPVFRIPFLSEIWNDTLYSNDEEKGVMSPQKKGRPGIYANFIPKAIYDVLFGSKLGATKEELDQLLKDCKGNTLEELLANEACVQLMDLFEKVANEYPNIPHADCIELANNAAKLSACFGYYYSKFPSRNLPGEVASSNVQGASTSNVLGATSNDTKERFIGATDCAKVFTRDISLKPRALQKEQGIEEQKCNLEARALPEGSVTIPQLPSDCTPVDDPSTPGHETNFDVIKCYILDQAAGQVEHRSQDSLALVMINMIELEAPGGNQCAVGVDDEIGIFQYIAGTWKSGYVFNNVLGAADTDSGSGTRQDYENGRQVCFGILGQDPNLHTSDPSRSWTLNFGTDLDGGAWNPFLQVQNTIHKIMVEQDPCAWTSYRILYPEHCGP